MGCDIHAAIEYRDGAEWRALLRPDPDYGKCDWAQPETAEVDFDRDYDLFAILADVRNGTWGDPVEPLAPNRGYPHDMTAEARAAMSEEHSATWVTLAELLANDWTRTFGKRGFVSGVEFERWDRVKEWRPEPESYCAGTNGTKVTPDEMRREITKGADVQRLYTAVEWTESYATGAKQLWEKALPDMLRLGAQYGYENVRLVMDFDS